MLPPDSLLQTEEAKLQLLTLSAKLVVLSHLDPRTPHLRPLAQLFTYICTVARYDLAYGVRDRARFLQGLLASGGVGVLRAQEGARLELGEDDFRRGVEVEQLGGGASQEQGGEEQTLTAEAVWKVLFQGKQEQQVDGESRFPLSCIEASAESPVPPSRAPRRRTRHALPLPPNPQTRVPLNPPSLPILRSSILHPRPRTLRLLPGSPVRHARPAGLWVRLCRAWRRRPDGRGGAVG